MKLTTSSSKHTHSADGPPPSNPPPEGQPFTVRGEVVRPDGRPLPRRVVRAYDRALCQWRRLGSVEAVVRTDERGRYAISYDPAQLRQWGKTRADLKVEVYEPGDDPDGVVKIAESPLILQALPHEVVNFSVGEEMYRGPDEYTRVETALTPLLESHDDLSCLGVADVLILAREAALAGSTVAYYVKARRWSAEFGAPSAMFYGLMRGGEPTRIDALLARPLARLWSRLEEAKTRNLIGLRLTNTTRSQLAELQQAYLSRPDHPYSHLLGTTTLSGAQSAVFTRELTSGTLTGEAFWDALVTRHGLDAGTVEDVRAAFELQSLTGENTTLTVRLRGGLGVRAPREVAAFAVEQWRDTVLDDPAVEIPDDVMPDGTAAQRRAAYAQLLYRAAELRYPTPSLAGQLSRDPLPGQESLQGFFTAHPGFEFRDQRVLHFLREQPQALQRMPGTARDELLRVEQLFHLVPPEDRLATIRPLWRAGLRSAPQVAYLGRGNLRRRVGSLDAKTAQRIYRKAVHVTSLALNAYVQFHPGLNRLSTAAVHLPQPPDGASAGAGLARSAITLPEWEELFGSPDACECSHCESALSPAAYLVDTMAYLEKAVDADGRNALDELLDRRPDLGTLRLTCENTETMLPHIDLVNQILEAIVAGENGGGFSGADIGETTWDSELLAAQPEHLRPAAYDVVRTATYPFHLPFDLWAEEGRRYLRRLGIDRSELMRVLPAQPGVGPVELATEALGMSAIEAELIRRPNPRAAHLAACWGAEVAELASVETLIRQAHIDYDTLLRLLNTRYVNPGRVVSVSFAAGPCSLDGAELVGEGGVALERKPFRELLDRLHRFLRLQRRLDCDEYELDTLIHALDVEDFDAPLFLPKLASVGSLRDTVGLTLPELASWWADLDTHAFEDAVPSRYEEVFLDEALFPDTHTGVGPDLRNAVFALRADRLDLAITTSADTGLSPWLAESDGAETPAYTLQPDYAAYVQSATRLTADDVLRLVQDVLPKDGPTGNVALNLANVSTLYRTASLTRALGISVREALRLMEITGEAPLRTASATPGPVESWRFHDVVVEIEAGAYSVEELAYLLLHEPAAVTALAPTSEDAAAWLASISPGFTGILHLEDERITTESKTAVAQSMGSALGADPAVVDALLFTHHPELGAEVLTHVILAANADVPGLPRPLRPFDAVLGQVHRFALAWNGLGLDPGFLPFVLHRGPELGWPDIAGLPAEPPTTPSQASSRFDAWSGLVAAAGLQASAFTTEQSLFTLLQDAAAQAEDPGTFVPDDFLAQISGQTGWPPADVAYLTGPSGFDLDLPTALRDERALVRIQRVVDLIRATGVAAEQAHAWTVAELGFAETQSIKQALSLSYPSDGWLQVLGSIQDELRTLKRDALLGHLLSTLDLADSAAFYERYLIDPDQSPLDRTSRIVLAHSAVQLLAQRILLNLEPFRFERQDAEAWQWRKRYRVWEAARKVFLRPENYLEPELRDNKSVFFRELEEGLLQDDVTSESAERLYAQYLHAVDDVSRLEIMGMYHEDETEERPAILHVFGRTLDVTRRYFYRRWEDETRWTPWEPVDLDITADHLNPVVSNARLFLFWPDLTQSDNPQAGVVTEKTVEMSPERADELRGEIAAHRRRITEIDEELDMLPDHKDLVVEEELEEERRGHVLAIDALDDVLKAGVETVVERGDRYSMEVGLNWSEYRDGRWTSAMVSQDTLTYTTSHGLGHHFFTGWDSDGVLRVSVRVHMVGGGADITVPRSAEGYIGYFRFDDCGRHLVGSHVEVTDPAGEVLVTSGLPNFHRAGLFSGQNSLQLEIGGAREQRTLLATEYSGLGRYLYYAQQYGKYGKETSPFFFTDGTRTYFVRLVQESRFTQLAGALNTAAMRGRHQDRMLSASGARGVRTPGAEAGEVAAQLTATQHFGEADSAAIIDRDGAQLSTSGHHLIDGIILADASPELIVNTGAVAATTPRYRFTGFYHPHTCLFLKQLNRYGVDGLLGPDPAWGTESSELYRQLMPSHPFDFEQTYLPNREWVVDNFTSTELDERVDFDHWSPYGWSNWESFFHIPMLIATRLMQNQRYAEARRWFHYVFDPTVTDGDGPERFWKIKPFYEEQLNGPLSSLEALLAEGTSSYEQQVEEWERNPFQPHVIARLRTAAYMQSTVMRYLTCVLAEADMLFRRDTREDIDEARQLYLLAAEILGDRPDLLPAQETTSSTPNVLLGRFTFDWNGPFGSGPLDVWAALLAADLPGAPAERQSARTFSGGITVDTTLEHPGGGLAQTSGPTAQGGTSSVDTLLLFCLPHNDALYGFWDTVADRLFKIRHSMNLSGQVRQLALFAPPIDPMLLVRASAAGLSIEAVLSGLFALRPHQRFGFLLQKALELCAEARGLGAAILAALEKQDGEQLAQLRSTHEVALLESIRAVKSKSVEEAQESLAGLTTSRESAELRATYYATREPISAGEHESLNKQEEAAKMQRNADYTAEAAAIGFELPTFKLELGPPPKVGTEYGGLNLGGIGQALSAHLRARATMRNHEANKAGTMAGYDRRSEDWKHQADLAQKEIEQLDRQIIAAEIRQQIAETDLANHDQQIAQAQEVQDLLELKFTNEQLYGFMVSRLASAHFQTYDLAYRYALQAETAFFAELGPDAQSTPRYIRPDNWDSLQKGLSAGERLHLQLRQLEAAYLSADKRAFEITKHVSLSLLDPFELLRLRETGACAFQLPEALFDQDFPGHYYRRIKSVRLSIPCVVGPYTSVSATLSLAGSQTRLGTDPSSEPEDDMGGVPQTAIATSTAHQDGGAFELSFNDPRYLPFEGAGVISAWSLELPSAIRPFDYTTISDVVMHVSYTAHDGGSALKADVSAGLLDALNSLAPNDLPPRRLFSLRHEFPDAWSRLTGGATGPQRTATLQLSKAHFPGFLDYDYGGRAPDGERIEPRPITLVGTALTAYLSPHGAVPAPSADILVNDQGATDDPGLGIPAFDLSGDLGALTSIGNGEIIEFTMTVDGALETSDWGDLYLLLTYEISV